MRPTCCCAEAHKNLLGWLSIAGLLALIAVSVFMLWGVDETLYNGLLGVDDFSLWFKVVFMGIGVFIILSSMDFVTGTWLTRESSTGWCCSRCWA